ncbi:P-loop containing nucleoside triphosphate hydrolase protein, partial [Rhizodiscina lignyota]
TSPQPPPTHSKGSSYIEIHSPAVLNALRSVTDYYPGSDYEGSSVTLAEPYAPIVFHLDELEKHRGIFHPEDRHESVKDCKGLEDVHDHVGIVLDFVKAHHKDALAKEYERHQRERPVCTFDLLWTLFKPGTDVYYDRTSAALWDPYVVQSVTANAYSIDLCLWNLEYDGQYLQPQLRYAQILPFEGEKEISSLDIFPCEYLREDVHGEKMNHDAYRKKLEERGQLYYRLTERQCMWYDGLTLSFPRRKYVDLVMIDTESYQTTQSPNSMGSFPGAAPSMPPAPPPVVDLGERNAGGIPGCSCERCVALNSKTKRSPFAGYARINPVNVKQLTPHQYFLCTRSIIGFVLKIRSWQRLDVGYFSEPKFKVSMIDDLVIQKETRDLIKSLARKYTRVDTATDGGSSHDLWSADSVQGKGEGMIFLLHGKPGVGKTYTAECISEYTQRPLLSLTCTDIGTDPTEVETKLRYWFKLAKHWGAILLIDEADIYMEQRITQDLSRNNLVAGFLRALEYYNGILFLTTNRVGTFDEAFISRIHVSIHYPEFTDSDRREVWNTFFRKLEQEREDTMRIPIATKEYATDSREMKGLHWNGREIRNAFQTAVALAEVENDHDSEGRIRLKDTHIKSIVRMSNAFKKYLRTLHQADESKKALREGIRVDDF